MISAEVAPYVKVGGLADVLGALPKALATLGHDVRVVCPLYPSVQTTGSGWLGHSVPLEIKIGARNQFAKVWEHRSPSGTGVRHYFLEYNNFFARNGVYDGPWGPHEDNPYRYTFLSRAGLDLCEWLSWIPDVVHCHDWSSALTPVFLNTSERTSPLGRIASVLTIHNLQHQGYAKPDLLEWARLPDWLNTPDNLESMGSLNMLKGGLYHSTKISTVSPSYAEEIKSSPGGCGLENLLRFRAGDLVGILNGIDTTVWNPSTDPLIPSPYNSDCLEAKDASRKELRERLKLHSDLSMPVFGVVSRLYEQKGLDLLVGAADDLLSHSRSQLVILGSGDNGIEEAYRHLHANHPDRIALWYGFDEGLAHLIYAGADFFVMPSRFEPCGLGQLYAMAYGTPPVVRATGGLKDTVTDFSQGIASATGFLFDHPDTDSLKQALWQAYFLFTQDHDAYRQLQINGMKRDFSWNLSALKYLDLYRWAIEKRTAVHLT